ncbi:MAG: hypothetical protein HBSAPP03_13340 [Phycisphaerae bacterium]|nr:MAG: hypothetical protein HBSAPP03_13340 [Phycisphaerae bacterium]
MTQEHSSRAARLSPMRMFVQVLLLVFIVEGLIMLVLPAIAPWPLGSFRESLADAAILSFALAPVLWVVIVRPLRRIFIERGELLRRLFDTQEAERARLARDLHDELGQHLTALRVGLRLLEQQSESAPARERAAELLRLSDTSLREIHRLARGLRPGVLEDFGLQVAVERLCEDFRAAHAMTLECTVTFPPHRRYEREAETALYRLVQESLTNMARHAEATHASVMLAERDDQVHLEVRDNGKGFAHDAPSHDMGGRAPLGLRSMKERVELLGGTFEVLSVFGHGTVIRASVPVARLDTEGEGRGA